MSDISYVKKITSNELEKWCRIRCLLLVEKDIIKLTYREINLMDNDRKKIFYSASLFKNEKRLF